MCLERLHAFIGTVASCPKKGEMQSRNCKKLYADICRRMIRLAMKHRNVRMYVECWAEDELFTKPNGKLIEAARLQNNGEHNLAIDSTWLDKYDSLALRETQK